MRFRRPQLDPFSLPANIRAKWPAELLGEGFVPLPKKLLRTLGGLFQGAHEIDELVVLLATVDYKRDDYDRLPTVEYLAFVAGIPEKRFKEALSRLKKKRWIEIDLEPKDDSMDISVDGLNRAVVSLIREEEPIDVTEGTPARGGAIKKLPFRD
jgi:hypothetical protein